MKLVHPDFFFQIDFQENKVNNIVIESPKIFENIISELYNQHIGINGAWVLSEKNTPIDIKKYSEIILNPFDLDINNKRILGKLYENIKNNATGSELYIKWNQLYPNIAEVIDSLIEEFNYNLEYNDEIEMKDLFKLLNLKFQTEEVSSLEKVIDYMNLHNSILGTKLFILVNLKSFYTKENLKHLYEEAFYKKFSLLLIDCKEYDVFNNDDIRYIIDKDGCVIKY